MTVKEFCLQHTKANELVGICDSGYLVHTVYIDHEDLFTIANKYINLQVKKDYWKDINIVNQQGNKVSIPCHMIDI